MMIKAYADNDDIDDDNCDDDDADVDDDDDNDDGDDDYLPMPLSVALCVGPESKKFPLTINIIIKMILIMMMMMIMMTMIVCCLLLCASAPRAKSFLCLFNVGSPESSSYQHLPLQERS